MALLKSYSGSMSSSFLLWGFGLISFLGRGEGTLTDKPDFPRLGAQALEPRADRRQLAAVVRAREVDKLVNVEAGEAPVVVDPVEVGDVLVEPDGAADVA